MGQGGVYKGGNNGADGAVCAALCVAGGVAAVGVAGAVMRRQCQYVVWGMASAIHVCMALCAGARALNAGHQKMGGRGLGGEG